MLNSDRIADALADSFRELIATLLTDAPVSASFAEQSDQFKRLRSEQGRKDLANRLGISVDELSFFNSSVADAVAREQTGTTNPQADQNRLIAQLRLFSWLETIATRKQEYDLSPDIEALVSEDAGRKRIRAMELVIRSLIGERHGDQQKLAEYLRTVFGDKVVDRWSGVADDGDLLSGTTFSELASVFVNKKEFSHHQRLYEDTEVLTLLKERRTTVQSFLEDIRRTRNTLAHNKKVSNIQLSLLDLYYDEVIAPVDAAHRRGDTQVNPQAFLQVSDTELNGYFDKLSEDVMSVKDDIADLKDGMSKGFAAAGQQAQRIESATTGINKKLMAALAGLAIVVGGVGFSIWQGQQTNEGVANINDSTETIKQITRDIDAKADTMLDSNEQIKSNTQDLIASGKQVQSNTNDLLASNARVESKADRLLDAGEEVAAKTDRLIDSSEQLAARTDELIDSNKQIVQSLGDIRKGFESLASAGGIIAQPTQPQEVYHNARLYEQRGDYRMARQNYVRFLGFNLDLVDPHLRFQSFLKLQEGRSGAREIYRELEQQSTSFVTGFAAALLQEPKKRVQQLTTFTEQHPEFAPAFYELSRDFSEARLGDQAMQDKAAEYEYLNAFLDLHEKGQYVKYMLDKELADFQLKDARTRLEALKGISEEAMKNPVAISGMMSNSGWMLNVQISGQVKEIFVRHEGAEDFKTTGHMQYKNPATGFPLPNSTLNLDNDIDATTFEIKYTDTRDREHGPYSVAFNPKTELISSQKKILEQLPKAWVGFRDYDGETLIYFSHMFAYRNAIDEIRYGIDKEQPDTTYRVAIMTPTGVIPHHAKFTAGDPKRPGAMLENEMPYFTVPNNTKFITVQLSYKDGTKSEVKRFKR